MISTMAFHGKEYWCWNCGETDSFFVSGDRREITEEEEKELQQKQKEAIEFLDARGCKYGGGMRKVNDGYTPFDCLPEELKEEISKLADSWVYLNE